MALRESRPQSAFQPVIDKLGLETCGALEVGGDVYNLNVNDFGPESLDWRLAGLAEAELGVDILEARTGPCASSYSASRGGCR